MARCNFATDSNDWFQDLALTVESMRFVVNLFPEEFARVSQTIGLFQQHLQELIEEERLRLNNAHSGGQL